MRYLVLLLAVAGCATNTPQQHPARPAMDAQATACRTSYQTVELDPIRSKIALLQGLERPTLEMMAERSYANDVEKRAILAFDAKVVECANGHLQIFAKYGGSDYVAAHQRAVVSGQQARLELYQNQITFGEYASKASALNAETRERLAILDRQRQQMAAQQHAADAARLGAAAALIQATTPAYQPITFQPMQVPRLINCTSIQQGAFTNTRCQ